MNSQGAAFLTQMNARTAELSAACPDFDVFAIAESRLLGCIRRLGFTSFAGSEHVVMDRLRDVLSKQLDEDAFWGLAYIDLWFCSNFSGRQWSELIRLNARNVRFAIQAALYVWLSSSSDSSIALAQLMTSCACWPKAREYLAEMSSKTERRWWVEAVLSHAA